MLCVLNFVFSWLYGLFSLCSPDIKYFQKDVAAQLSSIERRLAEGGANWQGQFQPEGKIFSYGFYGLSLINIAVERRADSQAIATTLAKLELLIPQLETCESEYPFTSCSKLSPKGGVIAAGITNLVRAGYVFLGGKNQRVIESFHGRSAALAAAFSESKLPFLESFPGLRWPVDNCCAIESLRYHDNLFSSDYARLPSQRWEQWLRANADTSTGMMIAQVSADGHTIDVPRGCALSWTLSFSPGFAPEYDKEQYSRFQKYWFLPVMGTLGIREWSEGQEKFSKIQEGPVLFGVGAAASGLGIAATHAHSDGQAFVCLLRGLESIGFPSINLQGEKSYFGQLFLLGDILALWGKTCIVWDRAQDSASFWHDASSLPDFSKPLILAVLISVVLTMSCFAYFFGGIRLFRSRFQSLERRDWKLASVALLAILSNLCFPGFLWIWTVLVLVCILWVEKWNATIRKFSSSSSAERT